MAHPRTLTAAFTLGLVAFARPAPLQAQASELEKKERDALAACDGQDVKKGIALLGRLYADTLEPTYIYNQGRCYQKNAMPREAAARFREFMRVTKEPEGELGRRALGFIAELEAEPSAGNTALRTEAPPLPPPRPATVDLAQPATPARGLRPLRLGGFIVGGVGLAAIGAGVVSTVQMKSIEDDVEKRHRANPADPSIEGRKQDGKAAETRQWIGYGVGAAGLAAGLTMVLLGGPEPGPLALGPLVTPRAHGAVLTGAF